MNFTWRRICWCFGWFFKGKEDTGSFNARLVRVASIDRASQCFIFVGHVKLHGAMMYYACSVDMFINKVVQKAQGSLWDL